MNRLKAVLLLLMLLLLLLPGLSEDEREPLLITNPYRDVDWGSVHQCRANLHAHTTLSDGILTPAQVIDAYHRQDCQVLALTDHNTQGNQQPTWPWQEHGCCPRELGMVAVEGNELSQHHHLGSYFSAVGDKGSNLAESLANIHDQKGLAVFFHPGRYKTPAEWTWYMPYFRQHPALLGMEVYNQGDRYPNDRALWDNVLSRLMPERPVWGFSNDDSHTRGQIGRNWNTLLLTDLDEESVRRALESGCFYLSYQPGEEAAPMIDSITADVKTITINAHYYREIIWISQGKKIHAGDTLDYKSTAGVGRYVRAEIRGDGGTTLTNPFGFHLAPRTPP